MTTVDTAAVDGWLTSTLKADTTLAALLSTRPSGSPAIYNGHAVQTATFPLVVFASLGGSDNQGMTVPGRLATFAYKLSCTDQTESLSGLYAIQARIETLIHNQSVVSGGYQLSCRRIAPPLPMSDPDLGIEYRTLLTRYRIWIALLP